MSVKRDVEKASEEVIAAGPNGTSEPIRKYLRLVREYKLRESENVATYGSRLIKNFRKHIPEDEYWAVMEQVAEAAADVKALDLSFTIVSEIRKKFPDSQRASRITAIYFEAKGKFTEEEAVLEKLLEDRPDSHYAFKRRVAMEKTKGNLSKAIELLQAYVDIFMTDREAWEELGELYLQAQMYPQAAFCYEEVLLHAPQNIALYVHYADILYTMGGPTGANYRTARSYYAAAVQLSKGNNVRALYGLCACAAQLSGMKGRQSKDEENLATLAAETLERQYLEEAEDKLPFVRQLLRAQGLSTK